MQNPLLFRGDVCGDKRFKKNIDRAGGEGAGLFSLLFYLEKVACFLEKREKREDKREEYKKKKAADATFSFWRRVRDSNPRFLVGTQHFECCTFDLSDNSPFIYLIWHLHNIHVKLPINFNRIHFICQHQN